MDNMLSNGISSWMIGISRFEVIGRLRDAFLSRKKMLPISVRLRIYKRLIFFVQKDVSLPDAMEMIHRNAREDTPWKGDCLTV